MAILPWIQERQAYYVRAPSITLRANMQCVYSSITFIVLDHNYYRQIQGGGQCGGAKYLFPFDNPAV